MAKEERPVILARAPFRISLGGGGTDLPSYYSKYGAYLLSAAINKHLYIYANRPAADDFIRLKYSTYEEVTGPDELKHDLVRPALKLLGIHNNIEIVSMADVPGGTGLGSSGTYLVALLTALHELQRQKVPAQALAEEACHIEMNLAGHAVGKHDHYMAAFGGITSFLIGRDGHVTVRPVEMSQTTIEDFRSNILLFYTSITRPSRQILQQQAEQTESGHAALIENMHRTQELGYRIAEALEAGSLDQFGLLLDEHWQNKKRRCSGITDPKIDSWYELARANGAVGGKIVGAGGGGFFMFYCANSHKAQLRHVLKVAGLREMPYDFDFDGAKVLVNF
jgi:D-glycero-alpha-D-manno-heptose-7-phosphate kinase